jgi:hypothetical protein
MSECIECPSCPHGECARCRDLGCCCQCGHEDTRDWRGHCPKCGRYPEGDHACDALLGPDCNEAEIALRVVRRGRA